MTDTMTTLAPEGAGADTGAAPSAPLGGQIFVDGSRGAGRGTGRDARN